MLLAGCANERIIEKPVPVEVVRVERIPIPADLLVLHNKTTIPETVTYGETLQLWAADRGIIDTLLGQLDAIRSLNNEPE